MVLCDVGNLEFGLPPRLVMELAFAAALCTIVVCGAAFMAARAGGRLIEFSAEAAEPFGAASVSAELAVLPPLADRLVKLFDTPLTAFVAVAGADACPITGKGCGPFIKGLV